VTLTQKGFKSAAAAKRHEEGWVGALRNLAGLYAKTRARPAGSGLRLTRVLEGPRSLAFKAWTDNERLARWWGPHGFTNPICEFDPRPGGAILIHMRAPDGAVYPMKGVVEELGFPERLVFKARVPGETNAPILETQNTVTLSEKGGKTALSLRVKVIRAAPEAAPMLADMEAGWTQSLERLAALLAAGK
jgi:uncharacterized protein YndB with AHSA1/START domain